MQIQWTLKAAVIARRQSNYSPRKINLGPKEARQSVDPSERGRAPISPEPERGSLRRLASTPRPACFRASGNTTPLASLTLHFTHQTVVRHPWIARHLWIVLRFIAAF